MISHYLLSMQIHAEYYTMDYSLCRTDLTFKIENESRNLRDRLVQTLRSGQCDEHIH